MCRRSVKLRECLLPYYSVHLWLLEEGSALLKGLAEGWPPLAEKQGWADAER